MITLEEISEKYQSELVNFFSDEQVIDYIYNEQYGSTYYSKNRHKCLCEYKDIMDNTVFIPYIRLEDFEMFLISRIPTEISNDIANKTSKNKGDIADYFQGINEYLENNYKSEFLLLKKLRNKKKKILKQYTDILMEKISEIQPGIFDENVPKVSNLTSNQNICEIKNYIKNNKKINSILKKIKIYKYIDAYKQCVDDKILIETSSYFKHRMDVLPEKYGTDILKCMKSGTSFVEEKIGKDSSRNCRYIYLPVLKYNNKSELLEFAIHEVMHISKEKVSSKKNRSGFFEGGLSKDKREANTIVNTRTIDSILGNIMWDIVTKKIIKSPKYQNKYVMTYKGIIEFEEVVHQWQVRKVLRRIEDEKIDLTFNEPYKLNGPKINKIVYNKGDRTTKLFMELFLDSVQDVNSGIKSIKKFKSEIGEGNYWMLGKLFRLWDYDDSRKVNVNYADVKVDRNFLIGDFKTKEYEYEKIGEKIIDRMREKVQKKSQKRSIRIQETIDTER